MLFFAVLVASYTGLAQQTPDSSFREAAIKNLIRFYDTTIGKQSHLYNGPLYEPYPRPFTEGHQFFLEDFFRIGSVFYDGLKYDSIPLKYDLIRDELLLEHYNQVFAVNLLKEKVEAFSFSQHSFIKIIGDKKINFPGDGFYDQLYSSPAIQFLAKRKKFIQETPRTITFERETYQRTYYYILKDGRYYDIKNKKSLMNLLRDKKKEMQQFIKNNSLRFKENFEEDVKQAIRYYDQLT